MPNIIKEAFTANGFFLKKRLSLHLTLQKGRENAKKLGGFDLDLEGCSNLARKMALFLGIALFCLCWSLIIRKKRK